MFKEVGVNGVHYEEFITENSLTVNEPIGTYILAEVNRQW